MMLSMLDQQTSLNMSHYNSLGYTSNWCTFHMETFYYFITYSFITSIISSHRWSILGFCMHFFEFVYGLITFYSRDKLSFAAYLSILVLMPGLCKMSQTLDLHFHFRFRYLRGNPYSLRGVIFFWEVKILESLNSLVNIK